MSTYVVDRGLLSESPPDRKTKQVRSCSSSCAQSVIVQPGAVARARSRDEKLENVISADAVVDRQNTPRRYDTCIPF